MIVWLPGGCPLHDPHHQQVQTGSSLGSASPLEETECSGIQTR